MPPVVRWVFQDPVTGETYTVPLNPNKMTPPRPRRVINPVTTTAVGGQVIVTEGNTPPYEWTFSGRIIERSHYEALEYWSEKQVRIYITDHYGRRFTVVPVSFLPTPKRARSYAWSHEYDFTCIVLDQTGAAVSA